MVCSPLSRPFTMQLLGGKIDYDRLPEGPVARMQLPISSLNS